MARLAGDLDDVVALANQERDERVAQVVGPRPLDARRRGRRCIGAPTPVLVRAQAPRSAIVTGEYERFAGWTPGVQPPFAEILSERPDEQHGVKSRDVV